MRLLPCKPGVCHECAVDHRPAEAHNKDSLYYQYKFHGEHGRWPTWKDAVAHLDAETQAMWEDELRKEKQWPETAVVQP